MKESIILKLANVVLQLHETQSIKLWADIASPLSELPDDQRKSVVQEYRVITENAIASLSMLATLALTTDESDKAVCQLLLNAIRNFRETKNRPEPFNEVLRD